MERISGHLGASARLATFVIASTSVCFGLVPLFARNLIDAGLSPEAVALCRFGLTLPLALYFLPRTRAKRRPALILVTGGLLMGLGWTTYLRGLDHLSVANAGLVCQDCHVRVKDRVSDHQFLKGTAMDSFLGVSKI